MKKKLLKTGLCVLAASSIFCFPALADDDEEKIGAMTIQIDAYYSAGDEVDDGDFSVSCNTEGVSYDGFDLDYSTATKDDGESWSKYDTPILTIYLSAEDGYYFDKKAKGSFKLEGAEAEFISADRSSDKTELELKVMLEPLQGEVGNVSDLYWSDDSIAHWTKGYKNKKYNVRLYYNNSLKATYETTNLSYDFANDMTRAGTYHFEVRGKVNDNTRADYIESAYITITDVMANKLANKVVDNSKTHESTSTSTTTTNNNSNASGPGAGQSSTPSTGWVQDAKGWWYRYSDGAWPENQWEFINNKWYYFDETGYMVTGWRFVNNKWYYMDYSGAMTTGWQYVNGVWYYLTNSGDMVTGWQTINNKFYYFDASGAMLIGVHNIDGQIYTFDNSGALK